MRRVIGAVCMLLGGAMVIGAGWLLWQNRTEEQQAAQSAESVLQAIYQGYDQPELIETVWQDDEPAYQIDGEEYIGCLELPSISLTLPVMRDWSYPKLRTAPCRYWGSAEDGTLVIMAHNYERHFGNLSMLREGDPVQFIDAAGEIYRYVVSGQQVLESTDIDGMIEGDWDMTLFSCTYGGGARVTVRLQRVLAYD